MWKVTNCTMKKIKFEHIRLIIYIISIFLSILVMLEKIKLDCYWKEKFEILCPACGLTRATLNFMKLNFKEALHFNAFYTCILLPLVLFLVINDVYIIFKRYITKKKDISFIEIMLGVNKFE